MNAKEIENHVEENVKVLKMIRGSLMIVSSDCDTIDAQDYLGVCAQKAEMAHIVERNLENLNDVIKALSEVLPTSNHVDA
jgi:hypothetical protein